MNVGVVAGVLAVGLGLSIGLVLLWFAARKVTKMVMAAFRKGKLTN
jgi:urease accessory protein UreF